jgi:hypothetical protein
LDCHWIRLALFLNLDSTPLRHPSYHLPTKGLAMSTLPPILDSNFIPTLVAQLGSTPNQIARSLLAKGCTGIQESPNHCPLANYLCLQGYPYISVDLCDLIVFNQSEPHKDPYRLRLPPVFSDFIEAFDEGGYPELIYQGES